MERELKKLVLMLTGLIEKTSGLSAKNSKETIQNIDTTFQNQFGFTLKELSEMSDSDLLERTENLHPSALDKLAELLFTLVTNDSFSEFNSDLNKNQLARKAMFFIDYLNDHSDTFSFQWMQMKTTLQDYS